VGGRLRDASAPVGLSVRSVAEMGAVKAYPSCTGSGRPLDTSRPRWDEYPVSTERCTPCYSRTVHDAIGTVQVTALGMFAGGGGFAIAPPTLAFVDRLR
jgi:hypothetical protein